MRELSPFLEKHLDRTRFPALAAAVVKGTTIVAAGVAGVRNVETKEAVSLGDKFHIGSCTKSMTALLAVFLQEKGTIRLTDRVGDVLKRWKLRKEIADITLIQLLQNRSGIGNDPEPKLWKCAFEDSGPKPRQRKRFLRGQLRRPLAAKSGTKFLYSNIGFALAGAMIETAAKESWENLVRKEIFERIELSSGGFGPPGSDKDDQPRGHVWQDEKPQLVPVIDNPAAIAPAGVVHLSILDAARYAAYHLAAARGRIEELKPHLDLLYSPPEGSDYALGWIVQERKWADGKVITHAGSNTMFYMVIWIAPRKDFACVVATNVGDRGEHVSGECDQVVAELIENYLE